MDPSLFSTATQYGFAGFAVLLVGVIVWLVSRLLAVLEQTNAVIARNTEATTDLRESIRLLDRKTDDELSLLRKMREDLIRDRAGLPPRSETS